MDQHLFSFDSAPFDSTLIEDFLTDSIMPFLDFPNISDSSPLGLSPSSLELESSSNGENNPSSIGLIKRRPIPRKGHTKSRLGCYNCKKRKIKCQETRPWCESCIKAGMKCEYPKPRNANVTLPPPIIQPQSTPNVFSMEDMQYFHHFLMRAYPHLPVGGAPVWTMDVPVLAHQYDYLIHSMLGLGASRLAMHAPKNSTPSTSGLAHRVKAVQLLGEAMKTDPKDKQEADARFATLMCLTFQSSCLAEGLIDFLTMLRGCVLSGSTIQDLNASCFASFMQKTHLETMEAMFDEQQLKTLRREPLDSATASLEALHPFCQQGVEQNYHKVLSNLIREAYVSPRKAYTQLTELYNVVGRVSSEEFTRLIDKSNGICQILLAHFLAVHHILRPITVLENPTRDTSPLFDMIQSWCCMIHGNLDQNLRYLNEWPISFTNYSSPWRDIDFQFDLQQIQSKHFNVYV